MLMDYKFNIYCIDVLYAVFFTTALKSIIRLQEYQLFCLASAMPNRIIST